ncbi:MAG: DNA-3-methyladenine glycosylase [Gammaproteobacteria bacterium 28-57-27]|nr:MAG: DNA-3-methyladenine glycosylase [Gammaproteobacteria bacterium 28-57-27]
MSSASSPCRCGWVALDKADYVAYHDSEWGVPQYDDRVLFEFMLLESAQAGLSWYTILRKREAYRQAFDGFDASIIALYDADKVAELLANAGIVRNRLKVLATINNAQRFLAVQAEFGSFGAYVWGFVGGRPTVNAWRTLAECPARTTESDALSADLKRRGFKFMGSTVCYAYMQAVGMVNDHTLDCFRRAEILAQD